VAAGGSDRIDHRYVLRRIREIESSEGSIGRRMRELDILIRRRVRRALADAEDGGPEG
jgi:hypothetical protein